MSTATHRVRLLSPGDVPRGRRARGVGGGDATASVDALRRILRALRILARKSELATGLSAAQLFVLTAIADQPGLSINDVARATMTDRTSVAAVLERLIEHRFVTRHPSPNDRRQVSLRITVAGRRAMARAAPPPTVVLLAGIRALTPAQRRALATGLTALSETMGVDTEPAGMLFEDTPRKRSPRR